jgi:hypothetical protein
VLVAIDILAPEISGVLPDVASSHFQAQSDILQFFRFLWKQRQIRLRPQFVHRVTPILLAELPDFEELVQKSVGNFLENIDAGKETSASVLGANLG